MSVTVEIDGVGEVQFDDSFKDLTREQQQRLGDGLRLGNVHRFTCPGRLKTVQQELVAVAGKAGLRMNTVGVEGVVPHPKQSRRVHASGEATA